MKAALLLANGFEEIEALTPVDVLRRAGISVDMISIYDEPLVSGAHSILITADKTYSESIPGEYDLLILPGGMPGSLNLDKCEFTNTIIDSILSKNGRIAAICAAPLILGRRGILNGKRAVCYPGFESELIGATIDSCGVVTDGNITTARGMGVALEFAKELVALLIDKSTADNISSAIMENN